MDSEEPGNETGYVTDSSFASRQGLLHKEDGIVEQHSQSTHTDQRQQPQQQPQTKQPQPQQLQPQPQTQPPRSQHVRTRKTKSERNKNHRGSVPIVHDSESEVSDARVYTHAQSKQRRRNGSKQYEKENFEKQQHRRGSSRRGSANTTSYDDDKKGGGGGGGGGENNKPLVARQQRPYRRDSRINSFMAFTHHADAISDAVFNTGPKHHLLKDTAPKYHHAGPMPQGPRRPKLPSTTDDSTDEIACLKAERKEIERKNEQLQSNKKNGIINNNNNNNNNHKVVADEEEDESLQFHFDPTPAHLKEHLHPNTPTKRSLKSTIPATPCPTLNPSDVTNTLRMNSKDIYTGTWNPKEKAVFNLMLKEEEKRKFKTNKSTPTKDKSSPAHLTPIYPLSEYVKEQAKAKQSKSGKSGIFSGFKWFRNVLKRSEKIPKTMEPEFVFPKDPIFDFMVPEKKKGLFGIFRRKKDPEYYGTRRRAQSTTSHYSVEFLLNTENRQQSLTENRQQSSHGSRHGSAATLISLKDKLTKRTKSEDNLNGAFEYFANGTQVFQRTPHQLRKCATKSGGDSGEQLDGESDHGFSAVVTENCEERYFYAEPKVTSGRNATRHELPMTKQSNNKSNNKQQQQQQQQHHHHYDSAFEEEHFQFSDETMRSDYMLSSSAANSDSCFSSIANSVPSYSYMSADIQLQSPYGPHAPHKSYMMAPCPSLYSPHCYRNNDIGTILSHQSAHSIYSSYSSENGCSANPPRTENAPKLPPRTYKDNGPGCRTSFDLENRRYQGNNDDLLLNSFHQRMAKHQTHNFWV